MCVYTQKCYVYMYICVRSRRSFLVGVGRGGVLGAGPYPDSPLTPAGFCDTRVRSSEGSETQTPGWIQKVDIPYGSIIYTIGVLESRVGGSTSWILPGVWERLPTQRRFRQGTRYLWETCWTWARSSHMRS